MRTTEEIKKEMTDAVLADETLCTAFGLDPGQEWDSQMSAASILNLIIYIVAMAARTLEWLHDQFRAEVEARIAAAFPGTVSWYWNKVMQFQYGHELNENGGYDTDDPDARIITHCAVFEIDNGIRVKVNKGDTTYDALTGSELQALREYVGKIKFAGTRAYCESFPPDQISLTLNIWRDPMVLTSDMRRIADGRPVVKEAVKAFLDAIAYGGVLNKTKLIDAIQAVDGVADVTIDEANSAIHILANGDTTGFDAFGQNFRSVAGHFTATEGQHAAVNFNDMTL